METNELMIGDCVLYRGEPIIIFEIDEYYERVNTEPDGYDSIRYIELSDLQPIPLTSKILEKSFPTIKDGVTWSETANSDLFNIRVEYDKYVEGIFKYVHELQHALRLVGIDKEIAI